MTPLPRLMVAPTGARRGKADHPALPMTILEIVKTASACFAAGAGAIHTHVRDSQGRHSIDAGLYRELLAELALTVPGMLVQITSEAGGRFTPAEQFATVKDIRHPHVSVALREMVPDAAAEAHAGRFYAFCADTGIQVQHILYAAEEIPRLADLHQRGVVPVIAEVLFPLGRYAAGEISTPEDLDPFLAERERASEIAAAPWMVCAFGPRETDCMAKALTAGGKARVGFENNVYMADGRVACDNAERIAEVAGLIETLA